MLLFLVWFPKWIEFLANAMRQPCLSLEIMISPATKSNSSVGMRNRATTNKTHQPILNEIYWTTQKWRLAYRYISLHCCGLAIKLMTYYCNFWKINDMHLHRYVVYVLRTIWCSAFSRANLVQLCILNGMRSIIILCIYLWCARWTLFVHVCV